MSLESRAKTVRWPGHLHPSYVLRARLTRSTRISTVFTCLVRPPLHLHHRTRLTFRSRQVESVRHAVPLRREHVRTGCDVPPDQEPQYPARLNHSTMTSGRSKS